MDPQTEQVIEDILSDYCLGRDIDKMNLPHTPDKRAVKDMIAKLHRIIFPGYWQERPPQGKKLTLAAVIEDGIQSLSAQLSLVFQSAGESSDAAAEHAGRTCLAFFGELPRIRAMIQMDLQATYEGDPAATGMAEIIFSYPGFYAITVYRLAHALFTLDVPLLPRIMTECAHSATGIDIHPGATIGQYFFIDHGTGIVIGETTVIGDHVKLYQGVTLGALSTRGGQNLRGKRRHPTIEDNVTIYAGASVLGGDTVIGRDCVIGSNAFITRSIAPCTTVTIKNQELQFKSRPTGCHEGEGVF